MHFCTILIDDFRGFSQISRFSTVSVHRFERFKVANCNPKRSLSCSFHASDQFSAQNSRNFDAWCKVLPCRGQKRSGHENPHFSQSVTLTCSKREFSCIFKGYGSRIFEDFRQFRDFQQFLIIVLNASRSRNAFK